MTPKATQTKASAALPVQSAPKGVLRADALQKARAMQNRQANPIPADHTR